MATILAIGTKWSSTSESLCHPDESHQVSAASDLLFGRCGLKNFKMDAMATLEQNDFSNSEFP